MDITARPLVSVIIPAYNSAKVIGEAIESILNQTYRNIECIIIDDRSSDDTWETVQVYASRDTRVRAYRNEHNLGIGGNRNKGIELARGTYICWQDGDDISINTRIERQVAYLEAHPDVGVVGGYLEFFGENTPKSIRKYPEHDAELRKLIFRYNPLAQPAILGRTESYRKAGMYDRRYRVDEDLDMLFRIGEKYEFANVQEVVIRYRQDENSLTRSNLRLMELTTIKLRKQYARSPAYHPGFMDFMYNLAEYISVFIVPPKLKIKLFTLLRNSS
jgi:glycosyltransferase involved in cell wall biosynthesis